MGHFIRLINMGHFFPNVSYLETKLVPHFVRLIKMGHFFPNVSYLEPKLVIYFSYSCLLISVTFHGRNPVLS